MSSPTRHALLIGINEYRPDPRNLNQSYPNLHGSVRDVELMEVFLQESLGVSNSNITTLKTRSSSGETVRADSIPTAKNITRALKELCNVCRPGDLVYIHYSGHGVRRGDTKVKNIISENNDQGGTGDRLMGTAIVPTDASENRAYITGRYIGSIIQTMVRKKEARVCLVLDSCHSGRGIRGDSTSEDSPSFAQRSADVDLDDEWMKESDEAANEIMDSLSADLPGARGSELISEWFTNPTGCTVMTACRSMKTAGEACFNGSNIKQGVHTYWMLDLLQKQQWERFPTYSRIRDHIHQGTRSHPGFIPQDPFVYGDVDIEFFGNTVVSFEKSTCNVVKAWAGKYVELDVGAVQGVAVGAIYQIVPGDTSAPQTMAKVEVIRVDPFSSVAISIGDMNDSRPLRICCPVKAELQRWALPKAVRVHFNTADQRVRNAFSRELQRTPNLKLVANTHDAAEFAVSIDAKGQFMVKERDKMLHRLPVISTRDPDGARKVAYVISHLARYRAIEGLTDLPGSNFLRDEHFDFTVSRQVENDPSGTEFEEIHPDRFDRYNVKENDIISFSFCFQGPTESLWMAIFDANEKWGIEKVYPGRGQTAWEMYRYNPEEIQFTMIIEPGNGANDPKDVVSNFIFFAAIGDMPSWNELQLPPLDKDSSMIELGVDSSFDDINDCGQRGIAIKSLSNNTSKKTSHYYVTSFQFHTSPR